MESKKYNKLVNLTKKKQTYRDREQTSGYHCGGIYGYAVGDTNYWA